MPLSKSAEEANQAQWKDVIRWREHQRGDLLLSMPVETSIAAAQKNLPADSAAIADDALPLPALARTFAASRDEIKEIAPEPKGTQLAFVTDSVSHRFEDPAHNEIYLVRSSGGEVRRLTNNQAIEDGLRWSGDSSKLFFHVGCGCGCARRSLSGCARTAVCDGCRRAGVYRGWALDLRGHSKTSP